MSGSHSSASERADALAGSVTRLIEELRAGDTAVRNEAALDLWERYSRQLLDLARRHLDGRVLRRENEEDVVQHMYDSFCRRLRRGQFTLDNRDDLWKLLVTMTRNKARKTGHRHTRGKRDVRKEQTDSPGADSSAALAPIAHLAARGTGPEEAALMAELLERMLLALPDPRLREIVYWKLEGYTNQEIADKWNCAVRTVERKLNLIRARWDEAGLTPEAHV